MRALIILLAVVLLLALVGWISFSKGPDRSSVNIETNQIRTDTKKAMQSGAELLHKAGDELKQEAGPQNKQAPPARPETTPAIK
jgi:hypothetical protein